MVTYNKWNTEIRTCFDRSARKKAQKVRNNMSEERTKKEN